MAVPDLVCVSFSAEINPTTSETLLAVCSNIANQGTKSLGLLLSSPGGSVSCGMTVYNVLRGLPLEIATHNAGSVNSIANVIFLAGEKRLSCPNASFMFHGVGSQIQGRAHLEQKDLRERLDSVIADEKKIGAVIVDRTKLTADEVNNLFLEAVTRDPNYARDKGIIDEIADINIPKGVPVQQLVFKR